MVSYSYKKAFFAIEQGWFVNDFGEFIKDSQADFVMCHAVDESYIHLFDKSAKQATLITDLAQDSDEIYNKFNKNYRYEIRRCEKENIEYKDKIDVLNQGIQHYKSIEDTLQNALVVAQGTAESVKQNAKAEADNIIKEAEINALKSVDTINKQVVEKRLQLDDTKKQFDVYKAKMEALLISQLELLKEVNKNENS